ncbi:MAG: FAD/FMN-containing dehydrogenase [Candidatus Aldehydirespiratoraceae bacterium]|jgi:FAD/FMN-containing dehydrogenase
MRCPKGPGYESVMDVTVEDFAASVGTSGPVAVVGSGSHRGIPGGVRVVTAPRGIDRIDVAEMVIECGASTPVDEVLSELAAVGQTVSVPPGGTIGGALAVGHSDVTRLGHGAVRDVLLQTHYVSASGKATKAGGPTVKNVSGFDLCRLFLGSYGTLGFFGDVILRTRPLPRFSAWFTSDRDPFALLATLYRPVSLLWNGEMTWVRLDGNASDVEKTVRKYGLREVDGPPAMPRSCRWSLPPSELHSLKTTQPGTFVAEIGVGAVHHTVGQERQPADAAKRALHDRIKMQFDPTGRLNPGVDPLTVRNGA